RPVWPRRTPDVASRDVGVHSRRTGDVGADPKADREQPLTKVRRAWEKASVLDQRIAISHASYKIRDPAHTLLARFDRPIRREIGGVFSVALKQVAYDLLSLSHDPHDTSMTVHARIKETLNGPICLTHRRGKCPDRTICSADITSRLRRQR